MNLQDMLSQPDTDFRRVQVAQTARLDWEER
jgi:hypothetical protein